jgi:D-alanyl-lipoteichoic acid acyltransferase DltB (MBOAT superfamily)
VRADELLLEMSTKSSSLAAAAAANLASQALQPASPAPVSVASVGAIPNSRLSNRSFLVKLEYAFYITVCIATNCLGIYQIYYAGQEPRTLKRSRSQLSPSWILPDFFAGVDLSDNQLHSFLANFPTLFAGLVAYIAVSRFVRSRAPSVLVYTHLVLNAVFVWYLHGTSALFMLAIYLVNYLWTFTHRMLPFSVYYGVTWVFHISVLFLNEFNKGYRFGALSPGLTWLDEMGTGLLRWYVIFNMSTLRMIGFNYDVWEAHRKADALRADQEAKHASNCIECAEQKAPCYRLRTACPRSVGEYNLVSYLAFITYVPLYIGGPLSSFNAYMSHLQLPQRAFDGKKSARYALRIVLLYLNLIGLLHFCHLSALRRDDDAFARMSVGDKGLYSILFLAFLWLKFNFIWKFFRLMAAFDGVEAPEDMNRCFSNTTTVAEFWRDWHASFNLWIVRYMYVPLGGNKSKGLAIFPIFIFIAVWHDIELHLLWWAGIMCVAFIPELVLGSYLARKCKWMRDKPYYRHVKAVGTTASTLSLVVANLFGYGTGMASQKGVEGFASNALAALCAVTFLFSSNSVSHLERAIRGEDELRRKATCGLVKAQ